MKLDHVRAPDDQRVKEYLSVGVFHPTHCLDRAVIAIFRKMGEGYQARINRILETWLQMKMAEKAVFRKEVMEVAGEVREAKGREDTGGSFRRSTPSWWSTGRMTRGSGMG